MLWYAYIKLCYVVAPVWGVALDASCGNSLALI